MHSSIGTARLCWFVVLAPLGAALASPSAARADVTDKFYEDATEIIEELISTEAAHSIVPLAMCVAPDLQHYYPRTLQALYSQQMSTVKDSVREETATALAYVVYRAAKGEKASAPTGKPVTERSILISVPLNVVVPSATTTDGYTKQAVNSDSDSAQVDKDDPVHRKTLEKCKASVQEQFETGDFVDGSVESLFEQACLSSTAYEKPDEAFACSLALASAAAIRRERDALQEHLVRAVSAIVTEALRTHGGAAREYTPLYEQVTAVLRSTLSKEDANLPTALAELLWHYDHFDQQPEATDIHDLRKALLT